MMSDAGSSTRYTGPKIKISAGGSTPSCSLADGHSVSAVSRLTAAARSSINRWVNWYTLFGLEGLKASLGGRKPVLPFAHISGLLQLLIQLSPQELGYQRSRWSTELMALELKRSWRLTLHASTIRRWLPRLGIVWRRAAPTLHIRDPHKERKMAAINEALGRCSADHPVFYEDEVDIPPQSQTGGGLDDAREAEESGNSGPESQTLPRWRPACRNR